jgi:hypothetical protein
MDYQSEEDMRKDRMRCSNSAFTGPGTEAVSEKQESDNHARRTWPNERNTFLGS